MSYMILSPSNIEAAIARREELVRDTQRAKLAARSRSPERPRSTTRATGRGLVTAALKRLRQRRRAAPNLARPTSSPVGEPR